MSKLSEERWNQIIHWIDRIAKPLVLVSVALYLIEGEMSLRQHWADNSESPTFFLWCERLIAGLFTAEFFIRWFRSSPRFQNARTTSYPFNVWGMIDLISILPYWCGFFVPASMLGIIRTFRIFRLLKFFRYSRNLQLTALKFYRAYHNMKGIAFSLGIVWLFFTVICLNLEYKEQPDKFGSLLDGAWFTVVTATTVGYGDASPTGIWGKLFVGVMLVPVISTMGMAFSAFSNACQTVQDLEDDPDIDPIAEWKKERERMKARRLADREYQMDD